MTRMKPETIARRKAERLAELAHQRELFLHTYAQAQLEYPLPEPPGSLAPETFHVRKPYQCRVAKE